MGLYRQWLFPRLCHLAMSSAHLGALRRSVLAEASGEVLELGFGTGLNLPHYPATVRAVTGVDPNPGMERLARQKRAGGGRHGGGRPGSGRPSSGRPGSGRHRSGGEPPGDGDGGPPVRLELGRAEELPFDDASFDTVVSTWTLCSVDDPARSLAEVARVLRPGGRFLFLEHGLSDEPRVARWQRRLTPLQRRVADGCHLDRDFAALLAASPLAADRLERFYEPKTPKVAGYLYRGAAHRGAAHRGAAAPAG